MQNPFFFMTSVFEMNFTLFGTSLSPFALEIGSITLAALLHCRSFGLTMSSVESSGLAGLDGF